MIPDRRRPSVSERALQEYFQVLSETANLPLPERTRKLMMARAELEYQKRGGSDCSVCDAVVRHMIPVLVERSDGTRVQHRCLCHRCLEAEKAGAMAVTLRLGEACLILSQGAGSRAEGDHLLCRSRRLIIWSGLYLPRSLSRCGRSPESPACLPKCYWP